MATTLDLFSNLTGDAWRVSHPFSDDLLQANALLHNTAATDAEMAECAMRWCLRRQPCQFGRVAASMGRIHFCFLREGAVTDWTDEEIAERIADEKKLWKQRAAFDPLRGSHSFVIVVSSPRVALARPDPHLRAFSDRILQLAGWGPTRRGARRENTVTGDFLYLKHPTEDRFAGYRYRFNVDYFACAGDGRWWHDHRFPGGIAFTANSYEGVLHTDHAVREEFFMDRQVAPTASKPYLMDFTYLYDERQDDFIEFTGGELSSAERVFQEVGRPEEWTHRAREATASRTEEDVRTVAEQLETCRRWKDLPGVVTDL